MSNVAYPKKPFDMERLEAEIGEEIRLIRRRDGTPAADYVAQMPAPPPPSIAEIGQVTAEAVMTQYEAAAKTIEEMKAPMQAWATMHEKALADLAAMVKHIEETAKRYRDMGQETHDKMQRSSGVLTEVRQLCDDIRTKINP